LDGLDVVATAETVEQVWTTVDVRNILILGQLSVVANFAIVAVVLVLIFVVAFKNRNL